MSGLDLLAVATDGIQTGVDPLGTPVIPITVASLGYLKPDGTPPIPPTPETRRRVIVGGFSSSRRYIEEKLREKEEYELNIKTKLSRVNSKEVNTETQIKFVYKQTKVNIEVLSLENTNPELDISIQETNKISVKPNILAQPIETMNIKPNVSGSVDVKTNQRINPKILSIEVKKKK